MIEGGSAARGAGFRLREKARTIARALPRSRPTDGPSPGPQMGLSQAMPPSSTRAARSRMTRAPRCSHPYRAPPDLISPNFRLPFQFARAATMALLLQTQYHRCQCGAGRWVPEVRKSPPGQMLNDWNSDPITPVESLVTDVRYKGLHHGQLETGWRRLRLLPRNQSI